MTETQLDRLLTIGFAVCAIVFAVVGAWLGVFMAGAGFVSMLISCQPWRDRGRR
jgi:hypothetical protein